MQYIPPTISLVEGKEYGDPSKGIKPFGHPLPYMIILNTFFLMTVLCFLRAHFSCPGKMNVKDIGWPWDPTKPRVGKGILAANALGVERKLDGRHRFCRICGVYKPDRAHHCRICGTLLSAL